VDVLVLDRVLDGDDVALVATIDLIDQCRERRRLARAGCPADDDQAVRDAGEQFDAGWQVRFLAWQVTSLGTAVGSGRWPAI